jgi:hypothetical protein
MFEEALHYSKIPCVLCTLAKSTLGALLEPFSEGFHNVNSKKC